LDNSGANTVACRGNAAPALVAPALAAALVAPALAAPVASALAALAGLASQASTMRRTQAPARRPQARCRRAMWLQGMLVIHVAAARAPVHREHIRVSACRGACGKQMQSRLRIHPGRFHGIRETFLRKRPLAAGTQLEFAAARNCRGALSRMLCRASSQPRRDHRQQVRHRRPQHHQGSHRIRLYYEVRSCAEHH
jgi:hypothetical protein